MLILGKSCLNQSLWYPSYHERGATCYTLEPPEPSINTPHDTLDFTFLIDPLSAAAIGYNELHMILVLAIPGTEISSQERNRYDLK